MGQLQEYTWDGFRVHGEASQRETTIQQQIGYASTTDGGGERRGRGGKVPHLRMRISNPKPPSVRTRSWGRDTEGTGTRVTTFTSYPNSS